MERKLVAQLRAEVADKAETIAYMDAENDRLRAALLEIAAGPYKGFEQCMAIARAALEGLGEEA